MSELVERAKAFALKAHEGQLRANGTRTMEEHIEEVAELIAWSGGSDEEVASGWLHDVVEDTKKTIVDIYENFGGDVLSIVHGLTDPPEFKELPTLERKMAQARRVAGESDSVKRGKLADQTSNVRALAVCAPPDWDAQKCLDYIKGAEMIAWECRDVSGRLYGLFCEAYKNALNVYGSDKTTPRA